MTEPVHDLDGPPPVVRDGSGPDAAQNKVKQTRPWVRFWARIFDYLLFGFVIGVLIGVFDIPIGAAANGPFLGMGVIFLWVFIESILLCTWGATPGKWIMHCTIRDDEGKKLSFMRALNRSFSVWWLGVGAGVPIISLITMIVACVKLSNSHVTTWDNTGQCHVEHQKVDWWRTLIMIGCFIIFAYLVALGSQAATSPAG